MYVCITYVCMYVCMYVYMYVYMYVCITYVCMYVYMYIYVCMYVCMYVCVCVCSCGGWVMLVFGHSVLLIKIWKKMRKAIIRFIMSVRPSSRKHGATRLSLNEFSLNLIFVENLWRQLMFH
jgi:hypothetical protein